MFVAKLDEQGRLIKIGRIASGEHDMLAAAYDGDSEAVAKALAAGAPIDMTDSETGLSALHIAVGTNNLALVRNLVEKHNASFFPDKFGRWPSLIAAECKVDDDLSDYIVEQEARYLKQHPE